MSLRIYLILDYANLEEDFIATDACMIGHKTLGEESSYYTLFLCQDQETLDQLKRRFRRARQVQDHYSYPTLRLDWYLAKAINNLKRKKGIILTVDIELEKGEEWRDFLADSQLSEYDAPPGFE